MAVAKCAAFSVAFFGNITVLPNYHSLALIRSPNTGQVAPNRPARVVSSTGYGKQKFNFYWLLSYPNSSSRDGFFDAAGRPAVRGNVHLLLRYNISLVRFSF